MQIIYKVVGNLSSRLVFRIVIATHTVRICQDAGKMETNVVFPLYNFA